MADPALTAYCLQDFEFMEELYMSLKLYSLQPNIITCITVLFALGPTPPLTRRQVRLTGNMARKGIPQAGFPTQWIIFMGSWNGSGCISCHKRTRFSRGKRFIGFCCDYGGRHRCRGCI